MSDDPTPIDPEATVARLRAAQARAGERPPTPAPTVPVADDLPTTTGVARDRAMRDWWSGAVPNRFQNARLADVDDVVRTEVEAWVANPTRLNLVLYGPVGVGKTHVLVGALRELVRSGQRPVFHPVVELLDQLRPGGPDDALARLARADTLGVDDLGSERPTEWTAERLYALINRRWMDELPTIATTNAAWEDLPELLGERTFSRLCGDAVVIHMGGDDRRLA